MKKIVPILFLWLCSCTASFGQQQWKWLNPQPTGATGLKIAFANSQTGFILTSDGQLLKTTDQGTHWRQTPDQLTNMACMDIADSTGVIAGASGVCISVLTMATIGSGRIRASSNMLV